MEARILSNREYYVAMRILEGRSKKRQAPSEIERAQAAPTGEISKQPAPEGLAPKGQSTPVFEESPSR